MHIGHPGDLGFMSLSAMWLAMMAAMMAPVAWPWVAAFRRTVDSSIASSVSFVSGYLVAWLVYAMAASLLQLGLWRAGALDVMTGVGGALGAGVLIGAGLYQFAPIKRACLTHCRNPFSYFLTRWQNGPGGGFRLGLGHGIYCVGCCWALMATTLAVGMAHLWWMAILTAAALVEQAVPSGQRIRVPLGIALIVGGSLRAF